MHYFTTGPLEIRDEEERILAGRLVPFSETALTKRGRERILPGAVDLSGPERIGFKLEHETLIGRAVELEERDDGIYGAFRVSRTQAGDDVLELSRDGALRGLSIGFNPQQSDVASDGVIEHRAVDLREVSAVQAPAYAGAIVTEVRNEPTEETMDEATATVEYRELTAEQRAELKTELRDELVAELEERAAIAAAEDKIPAAVETVPVDDPNTVGHAMQLVTRAKRGDQGARRELGTMILDDELSTRALENVVTSDIAGIVPAARIQTILSPAWEGRPYANAVQGRPLPASGMTVEVPSGGFTGTNPPMGYQTTEKTEIASDGSTIGDISAEVVTIAGGQNISLQSILRSSPSYLQFWSEQSLAAYASFLEGEVLNGTGNGSNKMHAGVIPAATAVTPTTAVTDAATFQKGLAEAVAAYYEANKVAPEWFAIHPRKWFALIGELLTGSPAVRPFDAPEKLGDGSLARINGNVLGLGALLTLNVDDDVLVQRSADVVLWEESGAPANIAIAEPAILGREVAVYGFSALLIPGDPHKFDASGFANVTPPA